MGKNSKSKKEHNSVQNILELPSFVTWATLFIVNIIMFRVSSLYLERVQIYYKMSKFLHDDDNDYNDDDLALTIT